LLGGMPARAFHAGRALIAGLDTRLGDNRYTQPNS
jgi:hypothetical protein